MRYAHGISVQWSPVNLAWLVMWHSQLLRIISDRGELDAYLADIGAQAIQ